MSYITFEHNLSLINKFTGRLFKQLANFYQFDIHLSLWCEWVDAKAYLSLS